MSQRGRPGSSQSLNESQRMPIEAAEALLWGKKTHDEHKFLFPRMRELEEQHRAYDSRIRATEAVAGAAEAATARILHVEQKVAAIELDEQDRPFDKWVEGEITEFKTFIEKNKSVRQKQIELENKVFGLEDVVDRNRDAHRDVQILLERIARLENERINDSKLIRRLDLEVARLASESQERVVEPNPVTHEALPNAMPCHATSPQAFHREYEAIDAADETEDEDMLPYYPLEQPVQHRVPDPPRESRSPTVALPPSPMKGRENLSARLRMMQRSSIYEPKQPRSGGRPSAGSSAQLRGALLPFDDSTIPATQIIDRNGGESKGPAEEMAISPPRHAPRKSLIVKLNAQKVKVEEAAPIPRVTRSQARKIKETEQAQPTLPARRSAVASIETQVVEEPAAKRRKLNNARVPAQSLPKVEDGKKFVAKSASKSTKLAKASPRKAAMPTKHEELAGRSIQSPGKKPSHALKVATRPQKQSVVQSNTTGRTARPLDSDYLNDDMSSNSPTAEGALSPRKKKIVQSKAAAKTSRALDTEQLDDTTSASSRTIGSNSSPLKKNNATSKAAAKAPRTMSSVRSGNAKLSNSRLASPKKTYSKLKVKREGLSEVQHDDYDFIDDDDGW